MKERKVLRIIKVSLTVVSTKSNVVAMRIVTRAIVPVSSLSDGAGIIPVPLL